MIDHVALYVTDLEGSRRFYERALEPLGHVVSAENGRVRRVRARGIPAARPAHREGSEYDWARRVSRDDRPTVDAFHAAATSAGGTDEGAPGVREHYHASYYAA